MPKQARNQDFMWGGANEAKDQTTEMYFLLSDPFIYESSNTWEIVTAKYMVGTEYYICRIQASRVSRFRFLGNAWWDRRSWKVSTISRISAITEYSFQLCVWLPFILSYFSFFNSSTTKPNQLPTSKVSSDGFRIILEEKITFKVVISGQEFLTCCNEFWGVRGVSNLQWSKLLAFWRSNALLPSTGLESFQKQPRTGCLCVCSLGNGNSCPTDCWRKDRNHGEREGSIVRFGKWIFFARSFYYERLASWKWCYNILATDFS